MQLYQQKASNTIKVVNLKHHIIRNGIKKSHVLHKHRPYVKQNKSVTDSKEITHKGSKYVDKKTQI